MRKPPPRRSAVAVVAMALVAFALGMTGAVLVTRPAAASSPLPTTLPSSTTTASTTTSTAAPATSTPTAEPPHFFVVNATVNAASDHEIVGSSAFPNFTTGAVDNYYSMAHSHVDNSPFAEGTGSPADTGPVGQTAAAGNTQQPQYADARWPGDSGTATYGSQGGPYAAANASEYRAAAEASEAKNGLSGPSGTGNMAEPKGLADRLQQALAAWQAKWDGPLGMQSPAPVAPPKATVPKATVPKATVPTPTATVTTPAATVTTPPAPVGGSNTTPPPVTVPSATLPTVGALGASRSLASASTPADGESLLASSTLAVLDQKTNTLVTSGESSLGRVSLGGGQIVIEGIHVSASITNDGTPTNKVAVSVGSASIGGVPVTIDQDGVHLAGQAQGLPYQQASDALNSALKQAGIQLFLVAPEITTNACGQTGTGSGTGSGSGTGTGTDTGTTTTASDQSNTSTTQSNTTTTQSSCDQGGVTSACDQPGTGTGTTTTTTSGPALPTPTTTTTTTTATTTDQSGTTTMTSSCGDTGPTATTSSCKKTGTFTGTTASPGGQTGMATGTTGSGEETVTATGVHVVFTQPVSQSGVPAQFAEHILGEVFLDSLAVPAGPLPKLDLSLSSSSSTSSACRGAGHARRAPSVGGASTPGGSSPFGASSSSSALSPSAAGFGSTSQPTASSSPSSTNGTSLPAAFAAALRKPLWLLLAYVVWQALVIGTGASLWNWRRGAP